MADLKGQHQTQGKRIRVLFNGAYIADSIATELVWEHKWYPHVYIPSKDVQTKYLSEPDQQKDAPPAVNEFAKSKVLKLTVDGKSTDQVTQVVEGPLKDYIRFQFDAMDTWFEEDTPIYVHPKDPYKRVDVLPSTRHIEVKIDGVTVADTHVPTLLFETLLPTRYYIPKTALKWEYVEESNTITKCPYKGEANYYSVNVNGKKHEDVIWWYKYPASESLGIIGLACFYNSKVDIYIDGVKEQKA